MALLVCAGALHQEPDERQPRRSRHQDRQRRHVRVSPALNGYTPERSRQFFERLEEELAATARRHRRHDRSRRRSSPAATGATTSPSRASRPARTPTPTPASTRSAPAISARSASRSSPAVSSRAPTSSARRRSRSSTRRSSRSSTSAATRSASGSAPAAVRAARHRDRRPRAERQVQRGQAGDPAALLPAVPAGRRIGSMTFYVRTASIAQLFSATSRRSWPGSIRTCRSRTSGR